MQKKTKQKKKREHCEKRQSGPLFLLKRQHKFEHDWISAFSQQSIARKNSSDGKIEYIMASMLIVLLDVW